MILHYFHCLLFALFALFASILKSDMCSSVVKYFALFALNDALFALFALFALNDALFALFALLALNDACTICTICTTRSICTK